MVHISIKTILRLIDSVKKKKIGAIKPATTAKIRNILEAVSFCSPLSFLRKKETRSRMLITVVAIAISKFSKAHSAALWLNKGTLVSSSVVLLTGWDAAGVSEETLADCAEEEAGREEVTFAALLEEPAAVELEAAGVLEEELVARLLLEEAAGDEEVELVEALLEEAGGATGAHCAVSTIFSAMVNTPVAW